MERFVFGLGIELDVEAFVKCCRGNMDLSEDGASVPALDVQQMGVEEEEEDGGEYVEYTEAPEFYVVDAECYYGEVNMEAATDDANPWTRRQFLMLSMTVRIRPPCGKLVVASFARCVTVGASVWLVV